MLLCLQSSKVVTVCSTFSILFDTLSRLMEFIFSISICESDDFVSDEWNASISFNSLKPEAETCLRIL